ncbi:MAG: hypothetical protein V3R44_05715 [bacterium]|jgi:hypothetical protein
MAHEDLSERITLAIEAQYTEDKHREIKALVLMCSPDVSEINLENARYSALMLSGGDNRKLVEYLEAIELDFRDVIYWYSLELEKHPG